MHDVIIVGARSAGAALGLLLARGGLKVLMVDRAVFPSYTMSGHFIHPAGVSFLRRHGVLDRLRATDTPAQETMTIDFGPVALTASPAPAADGNRTAYAPRRKLFDSILIDASIEAGVEFRDGVTVRHPMVAQSRVTGIEGVMRSGNTFTAKARLVVGADGKRSRFAEAVGAEKYEACASTTCAYYCYWDGLAVDHPHLFVRPGRFYVVAPTNDRLTQTVVMWSISEFDRVRSNLECEFNAALAEVPWIAERLDSAMRAERFLGTADLGGFFRTAYGPGWALLGDAGYHRDPITAQGMTDAFLHAELLADAIVDGLSGKVDLDAALAAYQSRRDAAVMPMYRLTCDLARLAPMTPDLVELIDALADNRPATERFLGVMAGTVAVEDFFSPDNLAAIVGQRRAA